MRIAMEAAKFTPDETNQLRKALATFRRRGTIGLLEEKMVSAMVGRGYERPFAERCFNQIKGFGEYGFPESHAASFAHLVYVSAWLKCHYPEVFAAALLNSQPMGFYAPAQIVRDACEHGVEARAADINDSDWDCTLEEGSRFEGLGSRDAAVPPKTSNLKPKTSLPLRLGLRQIDGIRQDEIEKIISARGGTTASPFRGEEDASQVRPPGLTCSTRQVGVSAQNAGLASHPTPHPSCHATWESQIAAGTPPPQGGRRNPFRSIQDLWARAGVQLATLERLAAADAFRSLGLDRRQALWEVKALGAAKPLPLFEAGFRDQVPGFKAARNASNEGSAHGRPLAGDVVASPDPWPLKPETSEPPVQLPLMPLSEHVVADYQTTRLSLKAHPMSFLRERLRAERARACAELKGIKDGSRVSVAGIVLVRQRPGTAKGVVFMTIEDETGIANLVIWAKTLERFRKVVMGARLVAITGRIQRHDTGDGQIIHIVVQKLEDRSAWLSLLSDEGGDMPIPIANADEVRHPEPGSARDRSREPVPPSKTDGLAGNTNRHPRDVRVMPKSRDFH